MQRSRRRKSSREPGNFPSGVFMVGYGDFSDHSFENTPNFAGALFTGKANFENAQFLNGANFNE
jgi:hypothetical protein